MGKRFVILAIIAIIAVSIIVFSRNALSDILSETETGYDDFVYGNMKNVSAEYISIGKPLLRKTILLNGGINCGGAVATDGYNLYVKCWDSYGNGYNNQGNYETRIGRFDFDGNLKENIVETGYINKSVSIAYLDGYIYNGYSDNGHVIERIDMNGGVEHVNVDSGLVCASTGVVGNCGKDILITSDGTYLYNLAYNTSGSNGNYYGWAVRKFDSNMNLVDSFSINEKSYKIGGVISNGTTLFALEHSEAPDSVVAEIDLVNHEIAKTHFDQYSINWINGQYDWINHRIWLGDLYTGKVYELSAPYYGIILKTDNTNKFEKPIDRKNMIVYYKMEGCNEQNEVDYTETKEDGIKTGKFDCVNGKFGNARWFDGYGDRIWAQSSQEFNDAQNLSVEFWVQFNDVEKTQSLFSAWYNDTERIDLEYIPQIGFVLIDDINNSNSTIIAPYDVNKNEWHYIGFTIDSTTNIWKLYVNGRLENSSVELFSAADLPDGWNITIGSLHPYDGLCIGQSNCDFDGYMDQLIVYNKTLNNTEIVNDYLLGNKYFKTGEYISKIFYQERATSWNNVSWEYTGYDGDVSFEFRTSDHSDNSWTGWSQPLSNPSNELNSSAKYIQFKIDFSSNSVDYPVSLNWFRVDYEAPDLIPPEITFSDVEPKLTYEDGYVNITVNATDKNGIANYILNITRPDGTYEIISGSQLEINETYNYSTKGKGDGTYIVKAIVEDVPGNQNNITMAFDARKKITFNLTVSNMSEDNIPVKVILYYPGTKEKIEEISSDGVTKYANAFDYNYDIEFDAFDGDIVLTLKNVNLTKNSNAKLVFDKFNGSIIYFVNSSYTAQDAELQLSYNGTDMDEDKLVVFSCDDWLSTQNTCGNDLGAVSFSVYKQSDYFELNNIGYLISNGTAFIIKESWCGDDVCSVYENTTSCPSDCTFECEEGSQRLCSDNYKGECAIGTETCTNGVWSGCPSPKTEICNGKDDDCNDIIDDIGGKDSIEATHCGCYGGASPYKEECNGIDDDCDGEIDEGASCCIDGDTQPCGSNVGECEYGTKTCSNGVWGDCVGGVEPTQEICFDHSDNDCDGEIDENCDHCSNGLQDYDEEGIDCGGSSCNPCAGFPWWILIVVGVVIIGMLLFLMKSFKDEGRELTWEELKKKYTPAQP